MLIYQSIVSRRNRNHSRLLGGGELPLVRSKQKIQLDKDSDAYRKKWSTCTKAPFFMILNIWIKMAPSSQVQAVTLYRFLHWLLTYSWRHVFNQTAT